MRLPLACLLVSAALGGPAGADEFDHYTNDVLAKVPGSGRADKVRALTTADLVDAAGVLRDTTGTLLVVKTGEGRWAKLLVQPAAQKIADDKSVPILLVERFVTYKEGTDRAVQARGGNLRLFPGVVLNLDFGQVVPPEIGGDLRVVVRDGQPVVEAAGGAEVYVLTAPLPGASPAPAGTPKVGAKFEPGLFSGVYRLHEDGRRSGDLHLELGKGGGVTGYYYSDKDGSKYEVTGEVGDPPHSIDFQIIYPRTVQTFRGYMFTGDGRAIAGSARMEQRETGFYAVRKGD